MRKMNPIIKAEWIKRLLSNDYRQGRGKLRARDHSQHRDLWCCLAVLADANGETWHPPVHSTGALAGLGSQRVRSPEDHGALSGSMYWGRGTGLSQRAASKLVEMNDGIPKATFKKIAAWIKENL